MARVKFYGTGTCPFCHKAKALLTMLKIPFEEIRVDLDFAARREFAEVTHNARTVPQILIDGKCIGGYVELAALHKEGRLVELTE
jgi:glutaredoxin 3